MQDAYYEATSSKFVAQQQKYLTNRQRQELESVLSNYEKIFCGKLGKYKGKKLRLEIDLAEASKHARPYAVAKAHKQTFLRELHHLVDIGVLGPVGAT